MKKRARILAIVLAAVFCVCMLAGCGSSTSDSSKNSAGTKQSESAKNSSNTEDNGSSNSKKNKAMSRMAKTTWIAESGQDYKRVKFSGMQFTLTTKSGSTVVGTYTLSKNCDRIELTPNGGDKIKSDFSMTKDTIYFDGTTFDAKDKINDDWK